MFGAIDPFYMAQIIGFIGYGLYMAAPYYKKRIEILSVELIGCAFLCLHWHLMETPVMVGSNLIWIYMILASMAKEYYRSANILISFAFLLVAYNSYIHWENSLLDYTTMIATSLAIICRFHTDLFKFRSYAFTGGIFSTLSGCCAASISAILFNVVFTFGHAKGLIALSARETAKVPWLNQFKLSPVRIRS